MRKAQRLYDSAGSEASKIELPLWHVAKGRMLFAGCLGRNALHSHSAPVMLAGLYDDFQLRIDRGLWTRCRAAIIRAGTAYEFDAGRQPLCVIYVEPNETSADGLARLIEDAREENGALIGMRSDVSLVRTLYEDQSSPRWVEAAMADLVGFSKVRARKDIDARVRRAIECVAVERGSLEVAPSPTVADAAHAAGLSTSRFQHLFRAEVGVPYRRYTAWARMRIAVSEVIRGSNLTAAAHASGFYDQPHFAREFRRIFGAPPSGSLANIRR
jgi:AraC-like DNA-binding protein